METINHEYYVSLEVAKLLKEAGFDWKQYSFYNSKSTLVNGTFAANWNDKIWYIDGSKVSAPTLDIAQRWLREVKKCYVSIIADCDSLGVFYHTRIIYYDTDNNYHATYVWEETELERVKHRAIFDNYEEALEAGIKKALELILEEGE